MWILSRKCSLFLYKTVCVESTHGTSPMCIYVYLKVTWVGLVVFNQRPLALLLSTFLKGRTIIYYSSPVILLLLPVLSMIWFSMFEGWTVCCMFAIVIHLFISWKHRQFLLKEISISEKSNLLHTWAWCLLVIFLWLLMLCWALTKKNRQCGDQCWRLEVPS